MAQAQEQATFLKQPPRVMGRDVTTPISNPASFLDIDGSVNKLKAQMDSEITNALNNLVQTTTQIQNTMLNMQKEQSAINKALHQEIVLLNKSLAKQYKEEKKYREEEAKKSKQLADRLRKQLNKPTKSAFAGKSNLGSALGGKSESLLEGLLDTIFPGLGRIGKGLTKKLGGWIAGIGAVMLGLPKRILGWVGKLGKWLWNLITKGAGKLFKNGKGLLAGLFGKVGNVGKVLGASIGGAFKGFGKNIANFFKSSKAVSVIGKNGAAKGSLNFLGRMLGGLVGDEKALAMMAGISGVKTGGILGKAGSALGKAGGFLGGLFGKKGASTALTTLGKTGGKGALKGATKLGGILGKKIPGLGLAVGAGLAASRFASGQWGMGTLELASGLASTIPGIGTAVSLGLDGVILAVDAFKEKFSGITQGFTGIFDKVKQGWQGFVTWLKPAIEKFKEIFNGIIDWFKKHWPFSKGGKNENNSNDNKNPKPKTTSEAKGQTWEEKHPVLNSLKEGAKNVIKKIRGESDTQSVSVATTPETVTGTNAELIWGYLKGKGFTDTQVAGIMGNLQAESGLEFNRLQGDFSKDRGKSKAYTQGVNTGTTAFVKKSNIGYGLAQWTYGSRKQGLLDEAKRRGVSIDDPQLQLDYLYKEMQARGVVDKIKATNTVRDASNIMLTKFEQPKDQGVGTQNTRTAMGDKILKAQQSGKLGSITAGTSGVVKSVWEDDSKTTAQKIGTTLDVLSTSAKEGVSDFGKWALESSQGNPILGALVKGAIGMLQNAGDMAEDFKLRYSSDVPDYWKDYRGVEAGQSLKQKETAFEMDENAKAMGSSAMGSKYGVRDLKASKYNTTTQTVMPGVNTNSLMIWQLLLMQP